MNNRANYPYVAAGLLVLAMQDMRAAMNAGRIQLDADDPHKEEAVRLLDRIDTLLAEIDHKADMPEATRLHRLEKFANRFLHPEDLGYSVSPFVRDSAREALGMPATETVSAAA